MQYKLHLFNTYIEAQTFTYKVVEIRTDVCILILGEAVSQVESSQPIQTHSCWIRPRIVDEIFDPGSQIGRILCYFLDTICSSMIALMPMYLSIGKMDCTMCILGPDQGNLLKGIVI